MTGAPLSEHGSAEPLRAPIARPETSVVLLLIKLTGHLHAESARQFARDSGKPSVHLTAGYNPEQIATVCWGRSRIGSPEAKRPSGS